MDRGTNESSPRLLGSHNRTIGSTEPVMSSWFEGHTATHVNDLLDEKETVCPEKQKPFFTKPYHLKATLLTV